jgi:hypothetical protein
LRKFVYARHKSRRTHGVNDLTLSPDKPTSKLKGTTLTDAASTGRGADDNASTTTRARTRALIVDAGKEGRIIARVGYEPRNALRRVSWLLVLFCSPRKCG